ncbi:unnamed protein product [Camellia sinensis]
MISHVDQINDLLFGHESALKGFVEILNVF